MTMESVINQHGKKSKNYEKKAKRSSLEAAFELQMRADGIEPYVIEYLFHPIRKWRFDYAWPNKKVAVEVEGGGWMGKSRHTSSTGFKGDCEKYDEALRLGWTVYRAHGDFVKSGRAIETLKILLEMKK